MIRASLVAQTVKNLPAMQESGVRSLSWEDPLEKKMATYSSILAWRIPWTEKTGGLEFKGLQRIVDDWGTNTLVSMCRVICVVAKGCLVWSVCSLDILLVSLCPASFCTPRPHFPVTPSISLSSYSYISVPYDEKDIFFWC